MENTSRRPRLRPQVYVHVEFGVSWTGDRPPQNHEVTYRSRALRERQPPFPRHVPAPNTNYLSHAPQQPQQHFQPQHPPVPYDWEMFHGYYAPPLPPPGIRHQGDADERRTSRSDSRSSHERGRSAPPPVGSNPWDVSVSQAQQQAVYQSSSSQAGQSSRQQPPEVWKALPEVPTRYRLGEDSLPWGAWSVPYGYDPEAHPQDDDEHHHHQPSPRPATASGAGSNVASATSPTEVSVFSPGPSGPGFRPDADPGRVQELGALGAALMTVDNGFENQWWHQGSREVVATGDVVGETIQSPQRFSRNSLGWAVASTGTVASSAGARWDRLSFATTDVDFGGVVSPLPAYVSPDSVGQPSLTRSLSTRSDELFFTERGRGALPA